MADSASGNLNRFLNPWVLHFQKLGLELKCPLCLDLLNKPILLPCQHIFCSSCISNSSRFRQNCFVYGKVPMTQSIDSANTDAKLQKGVKETFPNIQVKNPLCQTENVKPLVSGFERKNRGAERLQTMDKTTKEIENQANCDRETKRQKLEFKSYNVSANGMNPKSGYSDSDGGCKSEGTLFGAQQASTSVCLDGNSAFICAFCQTLKISEEGHQMLCPSHSHQKFPDEKTKKGKKLAKNNTSIVQRENGQTKVWAASAGATSKLTLCGSSLSVEEQHLLANFARISGVTISKNWTPNVTASTDERGGKTLQWPALLFQCDFVPSYKESLEELVLAAGATVLTKNSLVSGISDEGECSSKTLVVYSLDLPPNLESEEASFLYGALVIGHTWILESIAASKLEEAVA
ncbi:hypothetical protein MKX01_031548 [Papaver californicum]|nr:hypothetical protein MKX01_031548 [Papaver californicum]